MAAPSPIPREVAQRVALTLAPKVAELRAADAAAARAAKKKKSTKTHAPPGAA